MALGLQVQCGDMPGGSLSGLLGRSLYIGPEGIRLSSWSNACHMESMCGCSTAVFVPESVVVGSALTGGNPNLLQFCTLPDPQIWARYGIRSLGIVMPMGVLLSFTELSLKFHLPAWMQFWNLQLQHAARYPQLPLLKDDPIEELLSPGDLEKPLSTLYGALLGADSSNLESVMGCVAH